jgi:drug/metabolite transporter (DMT)-like permease
MGTDNSSIQTAISPTELLVVSSLSSGPEHIMQLSNQTKAYLYALTAVAIWSTVASAFKLSLRYMDHVQLLLYASLTSVTVLFGVVAVQKKLHLLAGLSKKNIFISMGMGALNPLLYYLILFKAYALLPAQEAQAINYTWAITMAHFSIPLLGQRLHSKQMTAIVISYSGILVIATHGDIAYCRFSDPLGTGLALISTVIWALYWIYNTRDSLDPCVRLFLNFCFGTLYILICTPFMSSFALTSWTGLPGAIYVGIFEMGITFVFWLMALKHTSSAARISQLIYLSPLMSLGLIHFLVGEAILPSTLIGLGLILLGVMVQGKKKEAGQDEG